MHLQSTLSRDTIYAQQSTHYKHSFTQLSNQFLFGAQIQSTLSRVLWSILSNIYIAVQGTMPLWSADTIYAQQSTHYKHSFS